MIGKPTTFNGGYLSSGAMRLSALLIAFYALTTEAHAQVETFGYLESQFSGLSTRTETFLSGYNKLRLDVDASRSGTLQAGGNVNFLNYYGKKSWNALDFIPAETASEVPDSMRHLYTFTFSDSIYLDNAYIGLDFERFRLTAGRQQLSFGTGYAWNPADIFNLKNILDPTYEQTGIGSLRLDVPVSSSSILTGVVELRERWDMSTRFVQYKMNLGRFDVAGVYTDMHWETFSFLSGEVTGQKRRLIGGHFSGELTGIGVWGEYAHNDMASAEDFDDWVLGGDYTFGFQLYVLTEYYRNGSGRNAKEEYDVDDWMMLQTGISKGLARDYLFTFLNYPLTDLLDGGAFAVVNLTDGSLVVAPQFIYNVLEDVDVTLNLNFFSGAEDSEYGGFDSGGGFIRIRAYF